MFKSMFKSKIISSVLLATSLCSVHLAQANSKGPWLQAKTAYQLMNDPVLQQEMQNIKRQIQCESFLYKADKPLVVASSANYVGGYCPVANQFIQLGLDHEIVPVKSKIIPVNSAPLGSMLRFEVAGSAYILALSGDLVRCDQQIKSSAESLMPLL